MIEAVSQQCVTTVAHSIKPLRNKMHSTGAELAGEHCVLSSMPYC